MKQNENYEKKYKEALERASHIKDYNTIGTPQEIAELIFPELKQELEQKECIWNTPEDKRHCEFCSAYCNKFPTISTTTTQTLEQAAGDYIVQLNREDLEGGFNAAFNAFKAGAEWRLEQVKADLKLILENFQKRAEHGEKAFDAGCPQFYQGQIFIISRLLTWCREYKRKIDL